ncbi:MAG: ABC transporter ATP-binding protein [Deltaproteobacteria bacterium]|nr:ABC transporter ATP-binding protein [Deltaproteobacteria bacterium]
MTPFMIELWQLCKEYPTPTGPAVIVKDFTLKVRAGEFVCILGHSGCGKSTVLSILMGLNEATSGNVVVADKEVTGPGRDRGVVFQSASLLPWLTVRDNVLLAIQDREDAGTSDTRRHLAERYLDQVGLAGLGDCMPDELSAGMRQRVGIARAFAVEPQVLLLDEPFSLLDALTRFELQEQLVQICEHTRKTVVMVTHDVDEALLLADRIVLMTNGPAATIGGILQVPLPRPRLHGKLLEHPAYYPARDQLLTFLESGVPPVDDAREVQKGKEKENEEVDPLSTINTREHDRGGADAYSRAE